MPRGKEGVLEGSTGEPLFTDDLLTLSKDVTRNLKPAGGVFGGHQRLCGFLIKVKVPPEAQYTC